MHAGIIEPGHFRFTANGEIVARLEERLGYVHKGIDGLLTDADIERGGAGRGARLRRFHRRATASPSRAPSRRRCGIDAAAARRRSCAASWRSSSASPIISATSARSATTRRSRCIHAHCGIFRERVLAAADRAFGHRLMMDRIVPGGVARISRPTAPRAACRSCSTRSSRRSPRSSRLYDDTPSLQDRTCTTGIVARDLVDALGGRRSCRPRLGPRLRRAPRLSPMRPIDDARFRGAGVHRGRRRCARLGAHRARSSSQHRVAARTGSPACRRGRSRVDAAGRGAARRRRHDRGVPRRRAGLAAPRADGRIARCHVRDASWFQWPLLEAAIENNIVADFPLCNKSFNCSYSGHDL